MKLKALLLLICSGIFIIAGSLYNYSYTNASGAPAGRTGSPGDNLTCASGCHVGSPTPQSGWITSDIPAQGYTPGNTYTITATATFSGRNKFGFEVSPQSLSGSLKGTIVITDLAQTQLIGGGKYITHKLNGTGGSGSKTWNFNWIAPPAGSGQVTFYGAFNAANADGSTTGDLIFTSSHTVQEDLSNGIAQADADRMITVFPNPVRELIHVDLHSIHPGQIEISLTDIGGKYINKLYSEKVQAGVRKLELIRPAGLPSGIYMLNINTNHSTVVKKLFIL